MPTTAAIIGLRPGGILDRAPASRAGWAPQPPGTRRGRPCTPHRARPRRHQPTGRRTRGAERHGAGGGHGRLADARPARPPLRGRGDRGPHGVGPARERAGRHRRLGSRRGDARLRDRRRGSRRRSSSSAPGSTSRHCRALARSASGRSSSVASRAATCASSRNRRRAARRRSMPQRRSRCSRWGGTAVPRSRGTSGTCSSPRRAARQGCCRARAPSSSAGNPTRCWPRRRGRTARSGSSAASGASRRVASSGLTGPRRWAEGGYQPGGFVELSGPGGRTERVTLPLATLERLA